MPNLQLRENLILKSKLLLVDDMPQNLQLLGTILSEKGFHVSMVSNGKQAIKVARNKLPDLILLDVAMPEMDGFDTCRQLKEDPITENIPIIFLTAKTEFEAIETAFEVGGVDYIIKPFIPQELILRVINQLELKFHRENLVNINQQLVRSNEEKEKFLSVISHDLRSPFHGLLGVSQIINENIDKLSKSEIKEYFELLDEGLHNQFKFLTNILQWGKLRRGQMEFQRENVNVADILKDVLATLKLNIEHKQISVNADFSGNSSIIYGDRNLIRELFHNLIANAIKFTNNHGEINISCTIDSQKGLFTKISDNGIGISEDNLPRIFQLDKKFSTDGTDKEIGSGLGLILCYEIVKMHGGEITINSQINAGTEVIFSISNSFAS